MEVSDFEKAAKRIISALYFERDELVMILVAENKQSLPSDEMHKAVIKDFEQLVSIIRKNYNGCRNCMKNCRDNSYGHKELLCFTVFKWKDIRKTTWWLNVEKVNKHIPENIPILNMVEIILAVLKIQL